MRLTVEQLNRIFAQYLKEVILPVANNPLDCFKEYQGGRILTRRLLLCLKHSKWYYIYRNGKVDCEELIRRVTPYLKRGIEIKGLGYKVTEKDLKQLIQMFSRLFPY